MKNPDQEKPSPKCESSGNPLRAHEDDRQMRINGYSPKELTKISSCQDIEGGICTERVLTQADVAEVPGPVLNPSGGIFVILRRSMV